MHRFRFLPLFLILLCLPPGATRAQTLIVEAQPGVEALAPCQVVHTQTCEYRHVSGVEGDSLLLDGEPFIVDWTGWGYYLDSGVVLEPMDETVSASGRRRWLETYPQPGRVHVSLAWRDKDENGKLNALDELKLESGVQTIQEMRLHAWIRSAPKE
jgi:hypothetical protein